MTIISKGLVGYWPFDEGSGMIAHDESGNGNDGELKNMTEEDWVDGKVGKCLDFDGEDDYVDCGNNISLKPTGVASLSFWANPSAYQTVISSQQIGFYQGDGYGFWQYASGGIPQVYVAEMSLINTTRRYLNLPLTSLPLDTWTHITIIFDGAGGKIWAYKNGELFDSKDVLTGDITYSGNMYIGNDFNGLIDEVRIYNRALTEGEIKSLFVIYATGHQVSREEKELLLIDGKKPVFIGRRKPVFISKN